MAPSTLHTNELKQMLQQVVWDYKIVPDELLEIFLQDKKGGSLTRRDLEIRLLSYYNWHKIIKAMGYQMALDMLSDEVISGVFPKSYQKRLYELRDILSGGALSVTG